MTADEPWIPSQQNDDDDVDANDDIFYDSDDGDHLHAAFGHVTHPDDLFFFDASDHALMDDAECVINAFHAHTTTNDPMDWNHVWACLLWKPLDVVKKTVNATTQYAKNVLHLPLHCHFKSRFPALNVHQLCETFATDTFYSSDKAIGGITCCQLYVGKTSCFTQIYPMSTESEMPSTLQDFIRTWGAMDNLFSDNAKAETSKAVGDILHLYRIGDLQSEPYHQNQNYAERCIQEISKTTNLVLDRSGAPPNLWLLCMEYVVYVTNRLAMTRLNDRTPIEAAFGVTPDISSLLQFKFFDKVLYLASDEPFPNSKELCGHFVGIAENVGDALTYKILSEHNQVVCHSVIHPAADLANPNLHASQMYGGEKSSPPKVVQSYLDELDPSTVK